MIKSCIEEELTPQQFRINLIIKSVLGFCVLYSISLIIFTLGLIFAPDQISFRALTFEEFIRTNENAYIAFFIPLMIFISFILITSAALNTIVFNLRAENLELKERLKLEADCFASMQKEIRYQGRFSENVFSN